MIVTRSWLSEYINLKGISNNRLVKTLNSIGLEVDRVCEFKIPKGVVYGFIKECNKHPDADKLNICQVDVGKEILQIVCGASNVRKGLHVAVATIGCKISNKLKITPVELRGVKSNGMICSSSELSLVDMNDGIMELDESIAKITLGEELCENSYLQDTLIEIELTANRGDCLSILGISRDLSTAFNRQLKSLPIDKQHDNLIGVGRVLQLVHVDDNIQVNLKYKAIDIKKLEVSCLVKMRLAQIDENKDNKIDAILTYTIHATGVILRVYDYKFFQTDAKDDKIKIYIKNDKASWPCVYHDKIKASTIGIGQEDKSRFYGDSGIVIIEASYIPPQIISKQMMLQKLEKTSSFYRSSRGSEPELNLGLNTLLFNLQTYSSFNEYGGSVDLINKYTEKRINVAFNDINNIIGQKIDKTTIIKIFQNLSFKIEKSLENGFVVIAPKFRHDIFNIQDIAEEILRFVGIDNIKAKPYFIKEKNCLSQGYFTFNKLKQYRYKSAYDGFFETVNFIFNEKKVLQKYNFSLLKQEFELLNPIVNTLDTLRPTLTLGLLNCASENVKSGYKEIKLFEIGSVFTSSRQEITKIAFLYSGNLQNDNIINSAKAKKVDFGNFVQKISNIIGKVELIKATSEHKLAHPYQYANIIQNTKIIGSIFKLHPNIANDLNLDDTFLCEINFTDLSYTQTEVKQYSKYQASFRDLSLLIPKELDYTIIKEIIKQSKAKNIIRFYPIDKYEDSSLKDSVSLTLRFILQSKNKTLTDEEITASIDTVITILSNKLDITLR